MRRVFKDSSECLHVWASQSQDDGRAGNVFFVGDTCYSYGHHFPMARIIEHAGRKAVLVNRDTYSVSTTRHQGYMRGAVRHLPQFSVDSRFVDRRGYSLDEQHTQTQAQYQARIDTSLLSASRARVHTDSHLRAAAVNADLFNAYAEFYGIPARIVIGDQSEAVARMVAQDKVRKAKALAEAQEYLEAWRLGLPLTGKGYGLLHAAPAALRIVDDEIETSHGARVPVSVAPGLWRLVSHCVSTGRPFSAAEALRLGHHTHAEDLRVGSYALNSISAKGDLKIGCHDIAYAELERMARTLGLVALV